MFANLRMILIFSPSSVLETLKFMWWHRAWNGICAWRRLKMFVSLAENLISQNILYAYHLEEIRIFLDFYVFKLKALMPKNRNEVPLKNAPIGLVLANYMVYWKLKFLERYVYLYTLNSCSCFFQSLAVWYWHFCSN